MPAAEAISEENIIISKMSINKTGIARSDFQHA
jgi:hypothetical protein